MKKLLLILFILVIGVKTCLPEKVKIGDLYYNLDESNWTSEVCKCCVYGSLIIPSSITYNGKRYNVTSIGWEAFHECSGLTSVTIPNSVTSIKGFAFSGCASLTSIIIPNSVTSIGDYAFSGCKGLTSIVIPNSVISIGDGAFENCSHLTSLIVASDNPYYCSIDGVLFDKQQTTLLLCPCGKSGTCIIPGGVKGIDAYAFYNCSRLTAITIPNSVTGIRYHTFDGCSSLTSITIPNSVTSIGEFAFSGCKGLTSIVIPNSVTSIERFAFSGCSHLTSLIVASDNPYYCSIDGVLFDKQQTTLLQCPCGKQKKYTIPNSVTSIGRGAFSDCTGLTFVTIPNSVTSIEGFAFSGCKGLTSIVIPNSVTSIGDYAFSGCSSLTFISMPNSVTSIEQGAWGDCYGLTSIVIPNSVTSIGDYAFYGCSSLRSVTIPNSVTSIGENAFHGCTGLTSITIPNSVTSIGENAFSLVPNVVYYGSAMGAPWDAKCINGYTEGHFVYKDSTKHVLSACSSEVSGDVVIPNSVTSIGNYAFYGCTELTSITIPNSVTSIGEIAFSGCASLTSITIPESVRSTWQDSFDWCESLKSVVWNATNCTTYNYLQDVFGSPFENCENITSFKIGENVETIPRGLCHGLPITSISIPPKVKSIGTSAFRKCDELTSVIIVGDVQFGNGVFYDCPNVVVYTTDPSISIPDVSAERVKKVTYQQLYDYPFSTYAKVFVEDGINNWQQKGEYERISDWQKRVNEQTRQQRIRELLGAAEQDYIAHHQDAISVNLTLGKYDADNEVYAITDAQYGDAYVSVPISEAKSFKNNWNNKQLSYQLQIQDDQFQLASLTITLPNGKEYIYRNTDDVKYNLAEIEYNFSPIDLDFASSNTSQNKQNVSITKYEVGQSDVDINIPETNASNPNTFVIIFANEHYQFMPIVPYAINDGNSFKEYCVKTLGIPQENVMYQSDVTLNVFRRKVTTLQQKAQARAQMGKETNIIFYYTGHGMPDVNTQSAYLMPTDGFDENVASGYKLDDLYQQLGQMQVGSITVFLDACFSGVNRNDKALAIHKGARLTAKSGAPTGNMVIFSASQGNQTASVNDKEKHGLFTYCLLKKLKETEGDVSLKELADYLSAEVNLKSLNLFEKEQIPSVIASPEVENQWKSWKLR